MSTKITKDALNKLFNKAQKTEQEKAIVKTTDSRFLQMLPGNTYKVRLLFLPTKNRQTPFIETKLHRHYNPNFKSYTEVICPTSEYLDGNAGFEKCPICSMLSTIWKQVELGDKEARKIYDANKRVTKNYAVVYVVKDPVESENNQTGKFKILRYGWDLQKVLDRFVMGKAVKGKPVLDEDEIVGFDAFDVDEGRDFIITVARTEVTTPNGKINFNSYGGSFSTKKTAVNVKLDDLPKIFKELKFDEDFLIPSDPDKLNEFYKNYVIGSSNKVIKELDIDEEDNIIANDDKLEELEEDKEDKLDDDLLSDNFENKNIEDNTSNIIEDELLDDDLLSDDEDEDEEDDISNNVEKINTKEIKTKKSIKKNIKSSKIDKKDIIEDMELSDDDDFDFSFED